MKTLTVQSVIFNNDYQSLERSVISVSNACRLAVSEGVLKNWEITYGDCSPSICLNAEQVNELTDLAQKAGGNFTFVFFNGNLGHGGGQNKLAELSNSDYFLFLNPDIVVAPDSIIELLKNIGLYFGATDASQIPLEHPKKFNQANLETSWASGAALLTPAQLFKELGGFDHETFFMYCDDVDYSWRVKLSGGKVTHTPTARVFHDKRLEINGNISASDTERYYSAEAALLLAYKFSKKSVLRKLLRVFSSSNDEWQIKALEEFVRRRDNNSLPIPIDQKNQVGYFKRGNYAEHRY